jgi:D5 N terminal like
MTADISEPPKATLALVSSNNVGWRQPHRFNGALVKPRTIDSSAAHHIVVSETFLGVMRSRGDDLLTDAAGKAWYYHDGLWSQPRHEFSWLNGEIQIVVRALGLPSTIALHNETRQELLRNPDVYHPNVKWDAHGMVPTRSGLLDMSDLTLHPARPDHFATWRIDCDYDPTAQCPWWLVMLNDFFADRPPELRAATISTLQEVLGTALMEVKPRQLTRALVLEGPSEAGKSQVLDVMAGLFGKMPIATPLDALGGTHGLMEFRRRAPWVLHEAFNARLWHMSSMVKSILTGDPVQINVKNGALTTQRINAPVFWGSNHPPQFREATKAIVNRLIVIKCRVVFDSKKQIGAAAEARRQKLAGPSELILKDEHSALLNWAIAGYRRAATRGYIEMTDEMVETLERVREDSNLVAGFIEDCLVFDPGTMISASDFCAAFAVWWGEHKGEDRHPPSSESIGRAMAALNDNRIGTDRKDFRDTIRRYYGGINLNSAGLDFWNAASSQGLARGKTARTSARREDVNRVIPDAWKGRLAVLRLNRKAVTDRQTPSVMDSESSDAEHDTSLQMTTVTTNGHTNGQAFL